MPSWLTIYTGKLPSGLRDSRCAYRRKSKSQQRLSNRGFRRGDVLLRQLNKGMGKMADKLHGGNPSMSKAVSDKMASKIGNQSSVGRNPGQISGLARADNLKAWSKHASDNSGGRDYNAGDHRDNSPAKPPKFGVR
jgi:hypothetical protein